MTTTVASLVDRVRDLLGDFEGDAATTLGAAISSTSATSIQTASIADIADGDWLLIDYELLRVTATAEGPPITVTVRRGARGTTAATHDNAALVIVNPVYHGLQILNALNGALSRMHKLVVDESTLTIVENQFDYTIPATLDRLFRVEIENSDEASEFNVIRAWDVTDDNELRIYGTFPTGRNLKLVGTNKFTRMAIAGSLDTDFPDTNDAALSYLVYDAVGHLLLERNAVIGKRDSFVGITDKDTPYDASRRLAQFYIAEAMRFLRTAQDQEAILQVPMSFTPYAGRRYLGRA